MASSQTLEKPVSKEIRDANGDPVGRISIGRVKFERVKPDEVCLTKGGIALPSGRYDYSNACYGIVIQCGLFSIHQTAVPFVADDSDWKSFARQFPLPTGTLIEHLNFNVNNKPDNSLFYCNTSDLVSWWLPNEEWPKAFEQFKKKAR